MFGKHFASTYTGSMFGAGPDVFAVWGYVIANTVAAQVELNPAVVAAALGMTTDAVERVLEILCSPDAKSRSQTEQGRRLLREGAFAYRVVNLDMYRAFRDESDRRSYNRRKKAEGRARGVNTRVKESIRESNVSAQAEAEAEAEARTIVGESQTTLLPDSSQKPAVTKPAGDPDFDIAWSRYPKRHGTNSRADALKQWLARRREGELAATMTAGVERYAAAMAADNKVGTELVMAAQRFFGKAKHYLEPWSDAETDASALTPEDLAAAVRAGEEAFAERAWQEERERRLFEFQGENLGSGKPYREQAAALDCYMTDPTSPYNSPGEWVPKPTLIKS